MQFNYIDIETIQGEKPISISSTLNQSNDLSIFEQEPIQCIIDYKWDTYAQKYIKYKFFLYMTFMIAFVWDLQVLDRLDTHGDGIRIKEWPFWFRKIYEIIV